MASPTPGTIVLVTNPQAALDAVAAPVARVDPATALLTRYTSAHSRRSMAASLRVVGALLMGGKVRDPRTVPWEKVRYEHAQAIRMRLSEAYASASANRHLMALRGVVKECWRLGLVEREVYDRVADVALLKHNPPDAGRALSPDEVAALYAACDASDSGRRDAAILVLTLGGGLRRSEVCGLEASNVSGPVVSVKGKGDKWRTVHLSPNGAAQLESWLVARGKLEGPLVVPCDRHGRLQRGKRLSDQGLYKVVQEIGARAKVADFRPHDLRRTFITRLLDKGADPMVVSKLVGHASLQTTLRYDKRGEKAKAAAVALLDD